MARVLTVTAEEERKFRDWLSTMPAAVQALGKIFDPWSLYLVKQTGQRAVVTSFCEDGTMHVMILSYFNKIPGDFVVSGIEAQDLEPCDLPPAEEMVPIDRGLLH